MTNFLIFPTGMLSWKDSGVGWFLLGGRVWLVVKKILEAIINYSSD